MTGNMTGCLSHRWLHQIYAYVSIQTTAWLCNSIKKSYTFGRLFYALTTLWYIYYTFQWQNPTLSLHCFRRLWPYPFATLGTFSLHSLRFTTLYYAFFATLAYTLVHFLHFTTLFYDQMLHFHYAILVDSDLHHLLHFVHFHYAHYAWLRFTTIYYASLATLDYTFGRPFL